MANLDSEYAQETLKLADEIERYLNMDVYDRERVPLIKDMKIKSTNWVSKYARGGSARSQVRAGGGLYNYRQRLLFFTA